MFSVFRKRQFSALSAALAPLVELARRKHGFERRVFLTELRRDAPTVAALVEHELSSNARSNESVAAHAHSTDAHATSTHSTNAHSTNAHSTLPRLMSARRTTHTKAQR